MPYKYMSPTQDASPAQSPEATVAVILVNYCAAGLTINCLRSLESEVAQLPGTQVIVSDNASLDGSGAQIADAIAANGWSKWARVLQLSTNGGFSFGNNAALRDLMSKHQLPRYAWLLNTDTIARPGALRGLVDFMEGNPEVGIAGSRLENPDGTSQCCAFRFHSIASEFEASIGLGLISKLLAKWAVAMKPADQPIPCDWVSGASFFVRSTVFRDVGMLDERYFLYYEETDFCRRAKRIGISCWHVPQSRVLHLEGKTTGVTDRSTPTRRRLGHWFDSRRRYYIKHHGTAYAVLADAALAVGTVVCRFRDRLLWRSPRHPQRFLRDLASHNPLVRHETHVESHARGFAHDRSL